MSDVIWNRLVAAACAILFVAAALSPFDLPRFDKFAGLIGALMSLGLAGLGAYLTWRAVGIAEGNDKVTKKLVRLTKGQHALLAELNSLQARQAEISEKQYATAIALSELKPEMSVHSAVRVQSQATEYTLELWVENNGKRSCRDLRWELLLPIRPGGDEQLDRTFPSEEPDDVTTNAISFPPGGPAFMYERVSGYLTKPIYPLQKYPLGTISGKVGKAAPIVAYWLLDTDDGPFPREPNAYGEVKWFTEDDDIIED